MSAGKRLCLFLMALVILWSGRIAAYAEEGEKKTGSVSEEAVKEVQRKTGDELFEKLDQREIDRVLRDIFPGEKVTFRKVVEAFLDGKPTIQTEVLGAYAEDTLFYVIRANRPAAGYLLLLIIVAAVLSGFSGVFQSRQVSQMGFYLVYILMITCCLHTFRMTAATVEEGIGKLLRFMEVFSPAFFICMAAAVGSISSIAFYNLVLFLLFLVELVIQHVILPLIHICLMVQVLNFLSEEAYLSKFAELIKMVVGWSLKTLLALVTGAGIVQGILSPSVDAVKRSALTKGAEMIPGIGDALGGMTEVVLGTTVLVKNGIGIAGAVLTAGICLFPILNMAVLTLLYKMLAAVVQPVSDPRIVEVVSCVGEGYQMLLQVVCTTGLLFLITIGVASAAAS